MAAAKEISPDAAVVSVFTVHRFEGRTHTFKRKPTDRLQREEMSTREEKSYKLLLSVQCFGPVDLK